MTALEPLAQRPDGTARPTCVSELDSGDVILVESSLSAERRLERTEELLDAHHDVVYRYAYRLTGCDASAEDLTQEVFLRAFRCLHQLRELQAERGWLLVIARNEYSRWCRKRYPKTNSMEGDAGANVVRRGDSAGPATDSDSIEEYDRREWLQAALQQLPEEYRIVLLMYYFEHLSYAQISDELDIPIGTVMSRLSRAKSQIKLALDELSDPKACNTEAP